MDKAAAIIIVQRFREALERNGVHVTTWNYSETSDIDVVVVSDSFTGLNHWQRIERMANALYELFEPSIAFPPSL